MNIGCDIIKNKRLENVNSRFIELVLTEKEIVEYKKKGLTYLTGRFAAKEAIMKCLNNTKKMTFNDIEVLNDKNGKPICNIKNIKVTISHEKDYTMAVAILIK